jgi:hypothetical protein
MKTELFLSKSKNALNKYHDVIYFIVTAKRRLGKNLQNRSKAWLRGKSRETYFFMEWG